MTEVTPYTTPQSDPENANFERKAGWFAITIGFVLTLISFASSFAQALEASNNIHYSIGSGLGLIFFAVFIVGLFQFSKNFRTNKSRLIIYNWALGIVSLSSAFQAFVYLVSARGV
jgi:hypothetical protein